MAAYAQQARDAQLLIDAQKIRLQAQRRAGEILLKMEKNKGTKFSPGSNKVLPPTDPTPKLAELGVTRVQFSKWQCIAKLSDKEFDGWRALLTFNRASCPDAILLKATVLAPLPPIVVREYIGCGQQTICFAPRGQRLEITRAGALCCSDIYSSKLVLASAAAESSVDA